MCVRPSRMNETVKEHKGKSGLRPWKPGESGNPAGRPIGARNKFSEDVIQVFALDWAAGGPEAIARVAGARSEHVHACGRVDPAEGHPGERAPADTRQFGCRTGRCCGGLSI